MGVKCPSCGFDAAADALYCDFCKEPFRKGAKKEPPAAAAPAAKPIPAPAAKPIPATPADLLKDLPKEVLDKLPAHLMMDEERIPEVRPWIRWLAWGFLFFWVLVAGVMTSLMWLRWQTLQR